MGNPVVCALLTDFGDSDSFVGVMKGVILKGAPAVTVIDVTHRIPPQDVEEGAYQLLAAHSYFPDGALFLCVVDPGVGSNRRILIAETERYRFIAPDNGLLSWTLEKNKPRRVIQLNPEKITKGPVSRTFHGRDVMAPAAARILAGTDPAELGSMIDSWKILEFPKLNKSGAKWTGRILSIDQFGNLITNVPNADIDAYAETSKIWIEAGSNRTLTRGLAKSYSDGENGRLIALPGSSGFIEIALRNGSAQKQTGLKKGDAVTVLFRV